MIIFVDMDNVTAMLLPDWIASYNKRFNDDFDWTTVDRWKFFEQMKPGVEPLVWRALEDAALFAGLKPVEGAINGINTLLDLGHDVYLLSTAANYHLEIICGKKMWIQKYLPRIWAENRYIFNQHKHLNRGDVLFDDYTGNLKAFDGMSVAMNTKWNQDWKGERVFTWPEFIEFINSII